MPRSYILGPGSLRRTKTNLPWLARGTDDEAHVLAHGAKRIVPGVRRASRELTGRPLGGGNNERRVARASTRAKPYVHGVPRDVAGCRDSTRRGSCRRGRRGRGLGGGGLWQPGCHATTLHPLICMAGGCAPELHSGSGVPAAAKKRICRGLTLYPLKYMFRNTTKRVSA